MAESQKKSRLASIIGMIAGIIAILTGLQNLFTGWPFKPIWIFNNHEITDVSSSGPDFKIDPISSRSDRALDVGKKFNYGSDLPIRIKGSTQYGDNVNIWAVCQDIHNGFYLQNPKVMIQGNEWVATNIRPGKDIFRILFVLVDEEGNQLFIGKTNRDEWGRFFELPANSKIIAFVELK